MKPIISDALLLACKAANVSHDKAYTELINAGVISDNCEGLHDIAEENEKRAAAWIRRELD